MNMDACPVMLHEMMYSMMMGMEEDEGAKNIAALSFISIAIMHT